MQLKSGTAWGIMKWAAAVALMLLLITTNVRFTASSLWLYEQLFERNGVPERTAISMAELRKVGGTIQDYFASDTEPLVVVAEINGRQVSLFGEDEAAHMADVKKLFGRTYLVQALSGAVLAIAIAAAGFVWRRRALAMVGSWLSLGSLMAAGVIAVLGVASIVAFRQVFLLFHYIGFPEGNFTFSTQTDYLVRVFPNGFWADITAVIAVMTLVEAALIWTVVRLAKQRAR
jgi:integral membrane protein (TIGR01906 family)